MVERISSSALFLLRAVFITFVIVPALGNDPFQGNFPTLKCLKPRLITGCNETLVDAYERSNASTGDKNINRGDSSLFLLTRQNTECPEFLHKCGGRLPSNTNFKPEKRTIFIVGGYISGVCVFAYFREMAAQFLYREDCNVILVDWSWGFYPDIYSSFVNAEVVGKQMAFSIIRIMEQTGMSEQKFYIIGHSVGAHIGGYAGRYFIQYTGGKMLPRITGLDPAGAAYTKAEDKDILDRSDAVYVDIIHTNAGKCFPLTIGIYKATGHADFFVNGGTHQPSCSETFLYPFLKGDFARGIANLYKSLRSHLQSTDYFKTSINSCGCQYIAFECGSEEDYKLGRCRSCGENGTRCTIMGYDSENCERKSEPTVYYVDTTCHCPYCDNKRVNSQGFKCKALETNYCFSPNTKPSTEVCTKDD